MVITMNKVAKILSLVLSATLALSVAVVMIVSSFAATVPEFSLNVSEETNDYVIVSVKLDKGAFKNLDLQVKTENTKKIGSCAYILSSDSFDAFNKKLQVEGGSAVAVGYAATQKFGAACTSAFNKTGDDVAVFKFNKKTADKITNEDLTLVVTSCSDAEGTAVTAKAVNNLPAPATTEPSSEPTTKPTTKPTTEPSTKPTTEPTTEATEPSTEATEPSTEATEPSTEATEPSTEATEPSTEATEPSTEATEPSTEATEPSTEATEATEATEPTTVPEEDNPVTQPTEAATEGGDVVNPNTGDSVTATAAIVSLLAVSAAAVVALRKKED